MARKNQSNTQPKNNGTNDESKNPEKSQPNVQLIGIVLGFMGVLLTVFATIFAPVIQQRFSGAKESPTPIVIVATPTRDEVRATETIAPTDEVSTLAPTNTPVPLPTETFTPVPTLAAGSDWTEGCISTAWTVYPDTVLAPATDGCYLEPVNGVFSARNAQLEVRVSKNATEQSGLFTEIPNDSIVSLNLLVDAIDKGQLWIGIFTAPTLDANGIMVVAPEGDPKDMAFAIHEMPKDKRVYSTRNISSSNAEYGFVFDVSPSDVKIIINKLTSTPLYTVTSDTSEKRYLYIGYDTSLGGTNRVLTDLYNLTITPR